MGETNDRLAVHPGDRRHGLRRIVGEDATPQQLGADGAAGQIVVVLEAVAPDDVHQSQGERGIGPRAWLDVPVGATGGRALVGIDRDDRRAGLARLDHQAPEMAVGVGGVRAPVDDEPAPGHGHRVGAHSPAAHGVLVAEAAGRGADGPIQPRGAQTVEEPSVQAAGLELAHRPAVAVGQDGLGTFGRARDRREPPGDEVEGLVPRDPLEPSFPLHPHPLHRVKQTFGAIDPIEEPRHLLAEEAPGERVIGIAPQADGHAVLDRHEHAARIRAIERADVLEVRRHR